MLVSSSPTPIFTHLFGPDIEPGYRPIHLPKLHIVTVDEPPGGFDGGLIINTIQLNHADRQGFAISLPVGNWIVFYSFIVDTRSRLHMNVRFAPVIGIGGRLATPPLPHHRAYGSVPRRFDRVKPAQA